MWGGGGGGGGHPRWEGRRGEGERKPPKRRRGDEEIRRRVPFPSRERKKGTFTRKIYEIWKSTYHREIESHIFSHNRASAVPRVVPRVHHWSKREEPRKGPSHPQGDILVYPRPSLYLYLSRIMYQAPGVIIASIYAYKITYACMYIYIHTYIYISITTTTSSP